MFRGRPLESADPEGRSTSARPEVFLKMLRSSPYIGQAVLAW